MSTSAVCAPLTSGRNHLRKTAYVCCPQSQGDFVHDLFFATYIPFQPLAASIGGRVGHPVYTVGTLVVWGILTVCHAFVKNDAQLIAVRILMGLAECGFYPWFSLTVSSLSFHL